MANKQKAKGSSFERELAKIFATHLGGNWQRVPNSGAFIGGKNSHRITSMSKEQIMLTRGDLIPPTEWDGIVVEAKSYKEFPFHQLFSSCKQLDKWIEQCLVDYELSDGKIFLVVFKISRRGTFVCARADQTDCDSLGGLDYHYNDRHYRISELNQEWFETNKKQMKELVE